MFAPSSQNSHHQNYCRHNDRGIERTCNKRLFQLQTCPSPPPLPRRKTRSMSQSKERPGYNRWGEHRAARDRAGQEHSKHFWRLHVEETGQHLPFSPQRLRHNFKASRHPCNITFQPDDVGSLVTALFIETISSNRLLVVCDRAKSFCFRHSATSDVLQ